MLSAVALGTTQICTEILAPNPSIWCFLSTQSGRFNLSYCMIRASIYPLLVVEIIQRPLSSFSESLTFCMQLQQNQERIPLMHLSLLEPTIDNHVYWPYHTYNGRIWMHDKERTSAKICRQLRRWAHHVAFCLSHAGTWILFDVWITLIDREWGKRFSDTM